MRGEISMRMADLHALECAFVQERLVALDTAIPAGDGRREEWLSLRWLDSEGLTADDSELVDRLMASPDLLTAVVDELHRRDGEIDDAIEQSRDLLRGPGQ